jgi:transcriptional regulator with XRE-family HTH domain
MSRALAALRRESQLLQDEVGDKIGISFQTLSRLETGQLPSLIALRALLDVYGVISNDYKPYEEIWRRANAPYWWKGMSLDSDYVVYVSMEHEADLIRDLQTTHIPVLLQTDDYFQAFLNSQAIPPSSKRLTRELDAHALRRRRINQHPVNLNFIITQSALETASLDRAQLVHLIRRSEQDNVTIQILPQQHTPLVTAATSFTLLSFPDKDEPELAYTQDTLNARFTQDPDTVNTVTRTFNTLTKHALSPADSHTYLKQRLHILIAKSANSPSTALYRTPAAQDEPT